MERKRTTIQDYRGYLRRHLAPFFGGRPLDKIDRDRVETFMLAKLTDGLSPKTVQNLLNFLHGIYAFSIKRQWATDNPVALVDRPRSPRSAHRRIRFLQPEELEALLRAVPDDYLGALERPTLPGRRHDGPAPRRAPRPALGRRRLERLARSRRGELHPRRIRLPEVPSRPLGADGRPPRPASSSVTSSARAGAATRTSSSPIRSPATSSTPPSCASASRRRSNAPSCTSSPSTSCATRSARRWPPPARHCARSRNGWATPTRARPRSMRTTRRTPRPAQPSPSAPLGDSPTGGDPTRKPRGPEDQPLFYDTGKASYPCAMKRSGRARRPRGDCCVSSRLSGKGGDVRSGREPCGHGREVHRW